MTLPNDAAPLIRQNALWMRRRAFAMVHKARPGHPGGDFSATHILATLYVGVLNHDPANPAWPDRGRFILSKGPATGALYTVLAKAGFFPETLLDSLRQPRSRLNGHPTRLATTGIFARVLNMATLNPLDDAAILAAAADTGAIVTVTEASVRGGLGGAVLAGRWPN